MTPSPPRGSSTSFATLVSLVLLYILLIILVLVFAGQVLRDFSFTRSSAGVAVIVLAIVFPILLLSFVVLNIARLVKQRAIGRPGARFKSRLVLFFAVVVLVATVPQAVLSVNFIRAATNAWFSAETGAAIRGAQEITLAFFGQKQDELRQFVDGRFLAGVLDGLESQPARVWERVQGLNPGIHSMQVFTSEFEETFFAGQPELRISGLAAAAAPDGQVTRASASSGAQDPSGGTSASGQAPAASGSAVSFMQVKTTYVSRSASGTVYTVVFATRLPRGFDATAGRLADALEFFVQLDLFQSSFIAAIAVFYAFFSVPLMLLSILVSFFLSEEVIRPIVSLEEATRRIAEGDFSIRILSRRGDELSMLIDSFNRMVTELERTRTKMIQTEKIAAWQEIAQRLAHEIKNPLTPIRLAAERSLRKYETESADFDSVFRNSVRSIIGEVDNLNALLTEFREFSRLPAPAIRRIPLRGVIDDIAAVYGHQPKYRITADGVPEVFAVDADPGQLKQALVNLCKNALEAMPDGGEIRFSADVVAKADESFGRIQVEDNGPGIPEEYWDTIFNPYVTSKRHGTGLGLAIVERIVFDHHGQIWFETQSGLGTTFYIDLPYVLNQADSGEP